MRRINSKMELMNRILFVVLVLIIQANAFCQEDKKTPNRTVSSIKTEKEESPTAYGVQNTEQQNFPVTISVNQFGEQITHDKKYFQDKVVHIDELLIAIDTKIEYVKANPSEHSLATQNGWYENMETTKEKLRQERVELLLKIESFN